MLERANWTGGLGSAKGSQPELGGKPIHKPSLDGAEKGAKLVGQIVSNKNQGAENHPNPQNVHKPRKNEPGAKPEKPAELKPPALKPREERQTTEEPEPAQDESQAENDIFLTESVGIDVSVDSAALNQFDYNESIDEDE